MATTPPHSPTYNVQFTASKISRIIESTLPDKKLVSIEQLESGKSFNNRIYFIKLASSANPDLEDVVLKVSGQFFGPEKVQNEVSCLYLLEKYCPFVPAPRVIAWFDGGSEYTEVRVTNRSKIGEYEGTTETLMLKYEPRDLADNYEKEQRGWVLLSRRPGRRLELPDLEGKSGERIMTELASLVSQFRTKVPLEECIGNIRLQSASKWAAKLGKDSDLPVVEDRMEVRGLLNCHYAPDKPIRSALEYYKVKLQDQVTKLETEDIFALNRLNISPVIRSFISNVLPALQLVNQDTSSKPTFTQYDFSPRNVLVSGSPLSVSGLVDFEFAGFFPPEEEFANDTVSNAGDWPSQAYEIFLTELERLGIETPLKGFPPRVWKEATVLMKLIEDVAPWILREGGIKGPGLEKECLEAAHSVLTCVEKLQCLVRTSSSSEKMPL